MFASLPFASVSNCHKRFLLVEWVTRVTFVLLGHEVLFYGYFGGLKTGFTI